MLLNGVVEKADREGRRIYLEATPDGKGIYLKMGWKVVANIVVDVEKFGGEEGQIYTNWPMIRDPQPIKGSS